MLLDSMAPNSIFSDSMADSIAPDSVAPRELSLYIHIPFCANKCGYCAFNSRALAQTQCDLVQKYMNALCADLRYKIAHFREFCASFSQQKSNLQNITKGAKKIEQKKQEQKEPIFSSVYIGGGTPSSVCAELYAPIFEILKAHLRANCEISIEANPSYFGIYTNQSGANRFKANSNSAQAKKWLQTMRNFGVNRLSLGVQSFYEKKLEFLERNHNAKDITKTINLARECGFCDISIDLIYGTPQCERALLESEIAQAAALGVDHISAYELSIESGSRFFSYDFFKEKNLNKIGFNNDFRFSKKDEFSEFSSLSHFIKTQLENHGFLQYEISNFTKNSPSIHNIHYWAGGQYLAVGAGAVGFFFCENNIDSIAKRYTMQTNIQKYIQSQNLENLENLNKKDLAFERIFLGLRSFLGVSLLELKNYATNLEILEQKIELLKQENKIIIHKNIIHAKDIFLADEIAIFLCD